jgi:hypothetical protein
MLAAVAAVDIFTANPLDQEALAEEALAEVKDLEEVQELALSAAAAEAAAVTAEEDLQEEME